MKKNYVKVYKGLFNKINKNFKKFDKNNHKIMYLRRKIMVADLKLIGNKKKLSKIYLGLSKFVNNTKIKLYYNHKCNLYLKRVSSKEDKLSSKYSKQKKNNNETQYSSNLNRGMTKDEILESQRKLGFITDEVVVKPEKEKSKFKIKLPKIDLKNKKLTLRRRTV